MLADPVARPVLREFGSSFPKGEAAGVLRRRPTAYGPGSASGECRERENPVESRLGHQRVCLAAACGSTLRPLAHRKTPWLSEASTSFRSSSPSPMKKLILSVLLALLAVAETFAQSSGTVPSVVITPSPATYSPAGGQVRFDVTLKWPTETTGSPAIPSLRINPPSSEWRYLGVGGANIPEIAPNIGDSSNPSVPDTGFGFSWWASPPSSGTANFSFVLSYPPGLTANPTIGVSANYSQNGTKTIPSQNIILTPQGSSVPPPEIFVQPRSLGVAHGGEAVLSVLVSGVGPISYQWMRNDVDLQGKTSSALAITPVSITDAGSYSVKIVSGGGGITSSKAVLSVASPNPISAGSQLTVTGASFPSGGTIAMALLDSSNTVVALTGVAGSAAQVSGVVPSGTIPGSYTLRVSSGGIPFLVVDAITVAPRLVRVVNQSAGAGSNVTVPIELVASGTENTVSFSLSFDPAKIAFQSNSIGAALPQGATLTRNVTQSSSGVISYFIGLEPGAKFPAGTVTLLNINFTIASGVAGGTAIPLVFGDAQALRRIVGFDASSLAGSFVDGSVSISSGLEGDVNGDGVVDAVDWVLMGRMVVALDPLPGPGSKFQRSDCGPRSSKGDGMIDAQDWVQIGRYVVAFDPIQTAGGPTGP